MRALPEDKKEILKISRSYIANVVYTIIGDEFQEWANEKIAERN